jgi:hypothetical protein
MDNRTRNPSRILFITTLERIGDKWLVDLHLRAILGVGAYESPEYESDAKYLVNDSC